MAHSLLRAVLHPGTCSKEGRGHTLQRGVVRGCSRPSSWEWMFVESSSLKADFGSWDDITIYDQARSLLQA